MILLKTYFTLPPDFKEITVKQLNEIPTFKWLHPGRWTAGTYSHHQFRKEHDLPNLQGIMFHVTLQETNISPKNGSLKMICLFPRWDMLISWRVIFRGEAGSICSHGKSSIWKNHGGHHGGPWFSWSADEIYVLCAGGRQPANRPVCFFGGQLVQIKHIRMLSWKRTKQGWLEDMPLGSLVMVFVGKQELALRYMF